MYSLHTRPAPPTHSQNNEDVKRNLQQQARGCQYLVLWLDCDREGENIAFEVSSAVVGGAQLGSSSSSHRIWRVYRMWPIGAAPSVEKIHIHMGLSALLGA